MVIFVGMEFAQILFAVLDRSVQQRHSPSFSSLNNVNTQLDVLRQAVGHRPSY